MSPARKPTSSPRRGSVRTARAASPQPQLFNPARGIDLKPFKIIRLAVSGDAALNRLETRIIDTADFQRMRRIRQLGTAHLVYPTALHTRFDHALGTLTMADAMVRAIRENRGNADDERRIEPEEEQLLRLYALLHDIGHIPFGHTLEDEFRLLPRHDEDEDRIARFLGPDSGIGAMLHASLGGDLYGRFIALMRAGGGDPESLGDDRFIHDLAANTICADLLDYLRRDAFFCSISLDLDYRFLRYLYLTRQGRTRRAVVRLWAEESPAPRRDVISELVRLLDNRYLLGERVYFHHAKLVSGAMIAGAAGRALRAGLLCKEDLYGLGDEALLDRLAAAHDPAVSRLASGVNLRRLWKQARVLTRDVFEGRPGGMEAVTRRWWRDPAGRAEAEDRAALDAKAGPGGVLIHCPGARMSMKIAETPVLWKGVIRPLKDCTDDPTLGPKLAVILKSHENLWALRVCAAPGCAAARLDTAVDEMLKMEVGGR